MGLLDVEGASRSRNFAGLQVLIWWQAENSDDWSYSRGVAAGFIPKDPSDRKYPNICG